ncbi:MAG TPA: hypothetical protein VKA55_10625 [Gammaproteobacteria bacterium]|nr:hypothetical protein [Gammaproteobacteria bacterium]
MTIPARCVRALAAVAVPGAVLAVATPAQALDTQLVGARGQAMAGANTASTDDTNAQYDNPAAFGFCGKRDAAGEQLAADNNHLAEDDIDVAGAVSGEKTDVNGDKRPKEARLGAELSVDF